MDFVQIAFYAVPVVSLLGIAFIWFRIISTWQRAFMHGAQVSLIEIMMTRVRKNPVNLIVDAYISLLHSGFQTKYSAVEQQYIIHKPKIITADDLVLLVKENGSET